MEQIESQESFTQFHTMCHEEEETSVSICILQGMNAQGCGLLDVCCAFLYCFCMCKIVIIPKATFTIRASLHYSPHAHIFQINNVHYEQKKKGGGDILQHNIHIIIIKITCTDRQYQLFLIQVLDMLPMTTGICKCTFKDILYKNMD